MPITYTPLRYPGGKTKLYNFVKELIIANGLVGETYIEPFAGGAGLALKLLFRKDVKRIIINDFDPAIYYFWYCILNYTEEICELLRKTPLTIEEWKRQRSIYSAGFNNNVIEYGYSTLFLNRTNVSGIIKGGVIGGIEQTGNYLIDARFNRDALIKTIKNIADHKNQIILTHMDAKEFLSPKFLNNYRKTFIYCDPPYVQKGSQLYKNSFTKQDHIDLFEIMRSCRRKWIVTYDICDLIENIYKKYRRSTINISYSVRNFRKAQEYVFFSDNIILPQNVILDKDL